MTGQGTDLAKHFSVLAVDEENEADVNICLLSELKTQNNHMIVLSSIPRQQSQLILTLKMT